MNQPEINIEACLEENLAILKMENIGHLMLNMNHVIFLANILALSERDTEEAVKELDSFVESTDKVIPLLHPLISGLENAVQTYVYRAAMMANFGYEAMHIYDSDSSFVQILADLAEQAKFSPEIALAKLSDIKVVMDKAPLKTPSNDKINYLLAIVREKIERDLLASSSDSKAVLQ